MIARFTHLCTLLLVSMLLTACAAAPTGPSQLNPRSEVEPSLAQHGVVALSLDMVNQVDPSWGPWKLGGRFAGKTYDPEKKQEVSLQASLTYFPGPLFGVGDGVKKGRNDMTAIVILPPGKYWVSDIIGSSMPTLIGAGIHFPVFSDEFVVEAGKGVYLGHVGIVVKEKTPSDTVALDEKVGTLWFLGDTKKLGQAMSGFGKTTPVLTLSNRFDSAVKEIKEDYPYLSNVPFSNQSLYISLKSR